VFGCTASPNPGPRRHKVPSVEEFASPHQKCILHLDGLLFWGSLGTVSVRLSSLNICRASIVVFACLALARASHAGEGARNIEVVPLHGTPMDTNFYQPASSDSQSFKPWSPQAPHPIQANQRPGQAMLPPPRPQSNVSAERERELIDRRRNWVFMTPEDYASDGKKDGMKDDGSDKNSATLMERYYQRLNDSDQLAGTNQSSINKLAGDRFGGQTNLLGGDMRPAGGAFGDSPFSESPSAGIFQQMRRTDISNPFGSDNSTAMRTPEEVRLEAQQKAHMEAFREILNIDQPAPAQVISPTPSAPVADSGPLFGLSSPAMRPINSVSTPDSGSSTVQAQTQVPTMTTTRNIKPPHADFAPQPRPF
jgi:hypothetical protein